MTSLRQRVMRLEAVHRPYRHIRSHHDLTDHDLMQIIRVGGFDPNDDATLVALAEGRIA